MDITEEENGFHGSVPEFGAIFMSNIATKRECFKKKVFGLPMSQANFVKEVKSGMVLFLFEYEKRELFGVYRASSDGGVNIVSHAFSSSGVNYPAQVRFTPIWICSPLSEPEFRGAISANYYSAKKFNFGLSQNQVRSLLMLFSTRKLRTNLPARQFTRLDKEQVENSSVVDDESTALRNGFLRENSVDSSPMKTYPKNFFLKDNRMNSDTHSKVDMINNEYGVSFSEGKYFDNTYTDSPNRRRAYDDGRISFDDVAHNRPNDHPLIKDKRLPEDSQFEIDDTVDDCNGLPSVMHSNALVGPAHFSRKTDDAIMFTDRERVVDKFNSSLGVTRLPEGNEKFSNNCTSAFASHVGWPMLKDGFEELPIMDNTYSPTIPGNKRSDYGTMVENPSSQYGFIHDSSENKHLKKYAAISEITSSHFVSTSSDKDELYGDTRSPVDPNRRDHSPDTFVGPGFPERRNKYIEPSGRHRRVYENTNGFVLGPLASSESTFCQNVDEQRANAYRYRNNSAAKTASYVENFDRVHESTNEYVPGPPSNEQFLFNQNVDDQWANAGWYRNNNAEKAASYVENYDRIHENANEYVFAPSASNEQSTCYQNIDEQLANAGWYRPNNAEKAASYVGNLDMHRHSHNEMEQFTPPNCGMSFFETALSRITEAANLDASPSKFHNATTITRALPSDHELTSHCGHSSYHQVDHGSSLVQKNNYHRLVEHNLDALPKGIAFHEKAGVSTRYSDVASADNRQRSHLHIQPGIHESHLNSDFPENIGLDAYRVPPASRPCLNFPSVNPSEEALQGENVGFPHLPFFSCSKPSYASNSTMLSLGIKDCIALQESDGLLYSGVGSEKNVIDDGTHRNISSEISDSGYKQCMRKSVFSRLSSNKCPIKEKGSDHVTSHDSYVMDTSVDDVMDMLQNHVKRKLRCKALVKCHDDNVVTIHGKHDVVEPDHNPSMITSLKKSDKRNVHESIEQKVASDAPTETRAVDFKRRSDITKRLHVCDSSMVRELPVKPPKHRTLKEKMPSENEVDKETACKIAKRRLLARPLFGNAGDTFDEADHQSIFHKTSNNEVAKETACKITKRRKLVRPLFGKAGGTFDESDHHSVIHKTSNDDPKLDIEEQHNTNDLPVSGHEKSSDLPADSSYRDGDGNITSLDNLSTNVLLPIVHENKDPNVKQSLDCENNRIEMHDMSVMDPDIKNPVQCSETAPLVASQCTIPTSDF